MPDTDAGALAGIVLFSDLSPDEIEETAQACQWRRYKSRDQIIDLRANQFTAEEGKQVLAEISRLREAIAPIPREVQPWLKEAVQELKTTQRQILVELAEVKATVNIMREEK